MSNTTVTNKKAGFIVLPYSIVVQRPKIGPNGPVLEGGKPVMQDVSASDTFNFAPGNNTVPTATWERIKAGITEDKWDAYYGKYLFPVCETVEAAAPTMQDVQEMNVPNAAIYIDGITELAELDTIEAAEKAGKNRSGVINAVNESRQAIQNAQAALDKDKDKD